LTSKGLEKSTQQWKAESILRAFLDSSSGVLNRG